VTAKPRRLNFALALVLAAFTVHAPSAAQSPAQPLLAPGEVLLEVAATGRTVRPAERARLLVSMTGRGATPVQARAAAEAQLERAVTAARGAGVRREAIREVRQVSPFGFAAEAPPEDMFRADRAVAAEIEPSTQWETRMIEILIADPANARRVSDALRTAGILGVSGPTYQLADDSGARGAARADALRQARAQAESFAAAANMRVARMLRIGARPGAEAMGWSVFAAISERPTVPSGGTDVDITEHVAVDFVLAPR
jgi:uncharacterized protein YggE